MWQIAGDIHWWEFVARGAIVYAALLLFMRMGGKRQIGQMSPFDLVLLLLVSNAVQNAMNAGDNSVTSGLILAATLFILNYVVGMLVARFKGVADIVEGQPQVLIHNGQVNTAVLEAAHLSLRDLEAELRLHSDAPLAEIHYAILETNGQISFHTADEHEMIKGLRVAGVPVEPSAKSSPRVAKAGSARAAGEAVDKA
ncbi:hypothetical protein BH11PSE11_BH11PSE11_05610 [soil metagenome]